MVVSCPIHDLQRVPAKSLPLGVRGAIVTPDPSASIASDVLRTARGKLSQERVGDAVGLPQQHVSQCEDPDSPRTMTVPQLVRAAKACPTFFDAVLRGLSGLRVVAPVVAGDLCERMCSAMSELGDVAREVNAAWADKRVDAEECSRVVREIDEAIDALQRLRRDVEAHAGSVR